MRKILLIGTVLVLPMNAMAQTADGQAAEGGPRPRVEGTIDGYRVAAIAAGAVVGVIVANVVTGGMITPVLLAGAGEAAWSRPCRRCRRSVAAGSSGGGDGRLLHGGPGGRDGRRRPDRRLHRQLGLWRRESTRRPWSSAT